ncbi:hypothetical protein [Saccharopolyspora gregorii]|uniref:Uncharacterized protein n=1 Tax=Saccharopolyspora gregorii TaxID=33914 RepID=A0ABP6S3A2_9PSEU
MSKYETTELPPKLQKFFKITLGMEWPEGSEGGLNAMHDALERYADRTDEMAAKMESAGGDIDDALDGGHLRRDRPVREGRSARVPARAVRRRARPGQQGQGRAADIQKNRSCSSR